MSKKDRKTGRREDGKTGRRKAERRKSEDGRAKTKEGRREDGRKGRRDGRVALVCAARKGLGKASALALARDGVRVAICSRGGQALRNAAAVVAFLASAGPSYVSGTTIQVDGGSTRGL